MAHLKKMSVVVYAIFILFSLVYLAVKSCTVYVSDGDLKPISMLSPKQPHYIEKNSNFTTQNTKGAGLPLHRPVSLFVLQCDFG